MPVMTAYTVRQWGVQWGTKQDLELTVRQGYWCNGEKHGCLSREACSGMNSRYGDQLKGC